MLPVDGTTYLSFTVNTAAAYACYPGTREPEDGSLRPRVFAGALFRVRTVTSSQTARNVLWESVTSCGRSRYPRATPPRRLAALSPLAPCVYVSAHSPLVFGRINDSHMKLVVLLAALCTSSCTAITLAPERPKPQLQRANKVLAFRGGLSDKNQAIQDILKPSIDAQAEKQARSMKEYEKSSPLVGVITLDDAKYACPDVAPMRAPPHHHRLGTTWKLHDVWRRYCHDDIHSEDSKQWALGDSDNRNSYWSLGYRCARAYMHTHTLSAPRPQHTLRRRISLHLSHLRISVSAGHVRRACAPYVLLACADYFIICVSYVPVSPGASSDLLTPLAYCASGASSIAWKG